MRLADPFPLESRPALLTGGSRVIRPRIAPGGGLACAAADAPSHDGS
jgi:hypothetical protein